MAESYFRIYVNCDGDISIYRLSEGELLRDINAELTEANEDGDEPDVFLSSLPTIDPQDWVEGDRGVSLLIRGEIVVPKPRQVVKEYELP